MQAKAINSRSSYWDYIILGSGIAGMAAAEAIRECDEAAGILMISAEKELCFNRPMLINEFALDGSGSVLFERQQGWPEQPGSRANAHPSASPAPIIRSLFKLLLIMQAFTPASHHHYSPPPLPLQCSVLAAASHGARRELLGEKLKGSKGRFQQS